KKTEINKKTKKENKKNNKKKLQLIRIEEEHKDSEDFETTTPLMKKIQTDRKKIGYIKRNKGDKIRKRFKKACNHYFDRLHALQDEKDQVALEAYHKKEELLKEVKALELTKDRAKDLPKIKEKIEAWKNIGNVPRNKRNIERKFNKALDKLFQQIDMNKKDAEMLKYENHLESLKEEENENKLRKEASFLYKKIDQTSDEIIQLETNLEFFDNADRDNPLMKDTFKNIDRLKQQLKIWEAKLEKVKRLS